MRFTYSTGQRPLDGYTLKRGIGRGGFGEVYYAVSDGGKEVGLKLITQNADVELRGIQQCLNVKHPNLVALFDLRSDAQGQHWVVMEYVAGESLSAILARHPDGVGIDLARQWFAGLAAAITYLHEHGIVHRDLKPGNIFLEDGKIKVGDYGLSKLIGGSQAVGQTQSVGTVHYMAPEISSGNYNRSIDIYAAGIILYEMLSGHVPFDGESAGEILMKHLTATPDLSKVPSPFVPVLDQALAKNPTRRYRTITEMARDVAGAGLPKATAAALPDTVPHPPTPNGPLAAAPLAAEPLAVRGQVAELCTTLLKAAGYAFICALVAALVLPLRDGEHIARTFFLTLACCWGVLIITRWWRTPVEDSWARRAILLGLGLAIGLSATWIDGYRLSAVWADEARADETRTDEGRAETVPNGKRSRGLGRIWNRREPQLPKAASYLAYFGLAFFAMRWWKLAERRRPRRFAIAAVFAAAFWGYVLLMLLPGVSFPDPGFAALVSAAIILQLVSPWQAPAPAPSRRLRLRVEAGQ